MDHMNMLLNMYAAYKAGEERSCGKKVRYSSEETAVKSAEAMNKKPTTTHEVEPYPCPFCGGWHLGGIWPKEKMEKLLDEMGIKTPAGILKAIVSPDPSYPGISVDLIDKDGTEYGIALVEYDEAKGIRTLAWTKSQEDFKSEVVWKDA